MLDAINSDLQQAMKAGDKEKVTALRLLLSDMQMLKIKLKNKPVAEIDVAATAKALIKQLNETKGFLEKRGTPLDMANVANLNIRITALEAYLPKPLSREELLWHINKIIGVNDGPLEVNKVMKAVMAEVAGRNSGKEVRPLIEEVLAARNSV